MGVRLRTSLNNGLNNGLRQSISGGVDSVVTTNLSLHLDAGNSNSYSGSGTDWLDLTSNNVDFTLTNGPVYNSGFSGYFTFDGSNDYADTTSTITNFGTNPFTVEIWHRTHTVADFESLLSSNVGGAFNGTYQIDHIDGKLRFTASGTGNNKAVSNATSSLNTWKQIVFVREGTSANQFKIYLNGVLDTTTILDTDLHVDQSPSIGRNRGGNAFFDGDISIIRMYNNKALSSSEVTQNFNANKGRYSL